MGTVSFLGVKRPGHGFDHPSPYSAEVKESVELYLYSPSGSSWPLLGRTLTLPLLSTLNVRFMCISVRQTTRNAVQPLPYKGRTCFSYVCGWNYIYECIV